MRSSLALIVSAALVLSASRASAGEPAETDLAPLASLSVSRFLKDASGFSELQKGPGAVRDGDPVTAWIVPGLEGETTALTFDWTGPTALDPFPLLEVNLIVSPADATLFVQTGSDLGHLSEASPDVTRGANGAVKMVFHDVKASVLALGFPAGAEVGEIQIHGGPSGGDVGSVTASCDDSGVHLALAAKGVLAVEALRKAPSGDTVRISQRRTTGTLTDATVRFDPRPADYEYTVSGVGAEGTTTVKASCTGAPKQRPSKGFHGVIEGFYGRPWTWHEREKVVLALGALGADTYVYAPKNDPLHRAKWRDPYDADTLARFQSLAAAGRAAGVSVVWAVSPGLDIDAQKQEDIDALLAKVEAMSKGGGIRDAALLIDDIAAPPSSDLGKAHVVIAKALLASMKARDPASKLSFVPTVYAGKAGGLSALQKDYLGALADLPAEVPVAWTGSGVFAKDFPLADAAAFAGLLGRQPPGIWIWDNYPVNDVSVFHRLYTRPVTGREEIVNGTAGLLSNPMRHALASIPALASYAELALDPAAYTQDRADGKPLQTAALAVTLADAEGAPPALGLFFRQLVHHDTLWPDDFASPELTARIADYAAHPEAGDARWGTSLALATHLAALAMADVDLRRDLDDTALADEIDAFTRATTVSARAVLHGMSGARASLLGDTESASAETTLGACAWLAADQPSWRTIQDAFPALAPQTDSVTCPEEDLYVSAQTIFLPLGQPWKKTLTPLTAEAGAIWELVGPQGSSITPDGTLTWSPDRLGPFRIVALFSGKSGTEAHFLDLVVTRAPEVEAPVAKPGCGCHTATLDGSMAWTAVGVWVAVVALARRRRRPGHRGRVD